MDRYRPIPARRIAGECYGVCSPKPATLSPQSPPPLPARLVERDDRKKKPATTPPPRPPSPPAPPPTLPWEEESPGFRLVNFIIIAAAIFAASLLLCIIYYTVLRRRRRFPAVAAPSLEEGDSPSLGEAEPLHHVWYIRTVGLDESTIASIAVAEYRAGDGLLDGVSDCSVCLGEFRDRERVRLLPKCGHAFHVPCIDTWLRAHINCPLCRAHIVDPDAEPTLPEATDVALPISAAGDSVDSDSSSTVPAEATQVGTLAPEEEAAHNRVPESTIETAIQIGTSIVLDSPPESSLSGDQRHLKDSELQPVRRSVSMDAPLTNAIIVAVEEDKDTIFEQESSPKNMGKLGSSSKGVLDPKAHSGVGRSLSSSGRGFFFSRPGRAARIHSTPM